MSNEKPSAHLAKRLASRTTQVSDVERARGRKRNETGKLFQTQLDATHENYLNRAQGFVVRQHGPFVRTAKRGWQPAGYARCDYAGHVNVVRTEGALEGEYSLELGARGEPVPVYFDAKVQPDNRHTVYHHPVELQHQLLDLRAALKGGGYAFLLVRVPVLERAAIIGIAEHFDQLMRPQVGVELFESLPYTPDAGGRREFTKQMLLPSCGWTAANGWHWPPLLTYIQRGEWP